MKFDWEAYITLLKGFLIFAGAIVGLVGYGWLIGWLIAQVHSLAAVAFLLFGTPALIILIMSNVDKL